MIKFTKRTIIFALLFIFLILTPIVLNQYYNYLLSPVSPNNQDEKVFVIIPGAAIVEIAQDLKQNDLIKDAFAFRLLVAQMGIGKTIQAGDFKLSPSMSSREIAQEITHGAIDIWVTLPEGLRVEEQAEKIEEKLKFGKNNDYNFDKKAYIKAAKEGYMFPDTYLIPKDADADIVASQLLFTFDEKVENEILKNNKGNLTNEQVIILASIIERESRNKDEKPTIAGILTNRLNDGIALQVDATVQYAKGYDSATGSWWPQITRDDYTLVKSVYNTYLKPGLPPAPISNPGIDSIKAALNPADTPYYYYLHDLEGKVHYAETLDEHAKNIKEFL